MIPLSISSMDVVKDDKELLALTPERNCDQTAMGLPPVTFAVFSVSEEYLR
jgi:hypothetical protein